MKNVLIVNNNLEIGGIQKSLINLLNEEKLYKYYNFTLLLFSNSGDLLDEVPKQVKIITPNSIYQILGLSKDKLKEKPLFFMKKVFFIMLCKLFGKRKTMRIMGVFQKKIKGYDAAISYSHLTKDSVLSNGCGEFVLDKTISLQKICLIHCDYKNSGTCTPINNRIYSEFDRIGCCSASVRKIFLMASRVEDSKVVTLRNFYNHSIIELSADNAQEYENEYINIIIVARLSYEKGIDIAINALYQSGRKDIRLYIIGDGPLKDEIAGQVQKLHLKNQIFLMGAKKNPYKYMKNADYLLVPSRHEAAPVVFDEAKVLNLSIISSETTSANEMLDEHDFITNDFAVLLRNLKHHKSIADIHVDNMLQETQLHQLLM